MVKTLIYYENTDSIQSIKSIIGLTKDNIMECSSKIFDVDSNDYSELIEFNVENGTLIFNNVNFNFLYDCVKIKKGRKEMIVKTKSIIDKIRFLNELSNFSEKFDITEVLSVWDSYAIEMIMFIINEELLKVEHIDGEWYSTVKRNINDNIKNSVTKPLLSSKTPTSKEVEDYISQKENYESVISVFNINDKTPIYKLTNALDCIINPIVDKHFESYLDSDKKEKMEYLENYLMDGLDIQKVYDGYSHYNISDFKYQIIELNNNFEDVRIYVK